jgi:hypothetical protein
MASRSESPLAEKGFDVSVNGLGDSEACPKAYRTLALSRRAALYLLCLWPVEAPDGANATL